MKKILAITISLLLSACSYPGSAWKKDISQCSVFSGYIGNEYHLTRDVGTIKQNGISYYNVIELNDRLFHITKQQIEDNIYNGKIGKLEKGTKVYIDSIKIQRVYAGPIIIYALGRFEDLITGKLVTFRYDMTSTYELPRTPWDDESIPAFRKLVFDESYNCK